MPQQSSDNPGWIGPGEPSRGRLLVTEPLRAVREVLRGSPGRGWMRIRTALANARYYVGRRRQRVQCPCCGWAGPAFLALGGRRLVRHSVCPQCGSRSRHRGLWQLLPRLASRVPAGEVLVFAPERVMLNRLARVLPNPVVTTDRHSVDVDAPGEDIQQLTFADSRFAMILCNHVLEHVPDDEAALRECARVLKTGGMAIFTIPGQYGPATQTLAEPDASGHFRYYGLDVVRRMQNAFGAAEAIDLSAEAAPGTGVRRRDYAFVCTRSDR